MPACAHGILGPFTSLYEPEPVPVQVLFNLTHGFEDVDRGEVVLTASLLTIDTIQ